MYSQLDASRKEIRLLHVHPGAWSDNIECHLETVSLDDNPRFQAISYVWGDKTITLPVTIDGQTLALTRNLFNGLQRLRSVDKTLVIFADAACIDQSNLNERSQQVQLMGEIYASAEEVFIWLGYGREPQAPVAQPKIIHSVGNETDIKVVNSYFKKDQPLQRENEEDQETEDVLGLFVYLGIRAMDKHLCEIPFFEVKGKRLHANHKWPAIIRAAKTLVSNPWWTRIWVVQETVLARKATVVYCNVTIPWTVIIKAVRLSDRHDLYCCGKLYSSLPYNDKEIMLQLFNVIHSGTAIKEMRKRGDKLSLSRIMRRTHSRNAADIRDKVFGVLGLVEDWQGRPPMVADYNMSPKEVFMQAIFQEIEGTNSLGVLIGITTPGLPGIPSWVSEKSLKTWVHNNDSRFRINGSRLFSAAGPHRARVKRVDDILITDGFEPLHRVSDMGPMFSNEEPDQKGYVEIIKKCRRMAGIEEDTRLLDGNRQVREEDFWRTMARDSWIQSPSTRDFWYKPEHSGNTFQRLGNMNVAHLGKEYWSWIQAISNIEDGRYTHSDSEYIQIRGFFESCTMSSPYRRFYITEDGHMGLGPPGMRPGDSIAILLGSNLPFCLRSVPDAPKGHYTLVGDTYLHGLMDGEGVPPNWEDHIVKIHLH